MLYTFTTGQKIGFLSASTLPEALNLLNNDKEARQTLKQIKDFKQFKTFQKLLKNNDIILLDRENFYILDMEALTWKQ